MVLHELRLSQFCDHTIEIESNFPGKCNISFLHGAVDQLCAPGILEDETLHLLGEVHVGTVRRVEVVGLDRGGAVHCVGGEVVRGRVREEGLAVDVQEKCQQLNLRCVQTWK